MKVLSLREPYATLIKDKKKLIETRSFKTSYRGELFIPASKTKIIKEDTNNQKLMGLAGKDLNFGSIICKRRLVDCIYMDKAFLEMIKKNKQEYLCGTYQEGRYAWILENVEEVKKIAVKGHLGIWNYIDNG